MQGQTKVTECEQCRRTPSSGLIFEMKTPSGSIHKCFRCAIRHRPMLKRSLVAALVVGSILTSLNQGDLLFSGHWALALYWKVPLTYTVPFCVATWGALSNARR